MQTLQLQLGDCIERLKELSDGSVGAVVTDPPYGISFMSKKWDDPNVLSEGLTGEAEEETTLPVSDKQAFQQWACLWLTECYRVLKPGGVIKVFSATRTYHRMAAAMKQVGFTIERPEAWCYGCLSEDTEIQTDQGFKGPTELKVGMMALGFDLDKRRYSWQAVEEVFQYPYADEAYRLQGHNMEQILSKQHRCVVLRGDKWAFVPVEELQENEKVPMWRKKREWRLPGCCAGYDVPNQETINEEAVKGEARPEEVTVSKVLYTGTVWCVRVATGAFVARRKGFWAEFVTGNSGFPKSLNISKALEKQAGQPVPERGQGDPVDRIALDRGGATGKAKNGLTSEYGPDPEVVTELAKQYKGYGTALKPAWEVFMVGRKPL
jgi:hypothetical protein